MKHKHFNRLLSMLLVVATLFGLMAVPASAASLGDSGTVTIQQAGYGNYLSKKNGGTIGGGYWKYTSNNGVTGTAYCVNHGLKGVSPSKALTVQEYNREPKTMGAFKWSGTEEPDTASLQVIKAGAGGAPLEGAEFTLTGDRGTSVSGATDRNGQIVWRDLPADEKFTLTETAAPEGYQIVAPMNVTLTAGRTEYVTITDDVERGFTIKKVGAQNKGSLQGAVFRFEQIDGSYMTTGITGFDGTISFEGDELPYGSYRITEQTPPDGYVKSDRVETVEWDGTKDVLITWENVRDISLTIIKVDEQTGVSLPNATFDVYADGKLITSVTTNDNGEARVTGIQKEAYIEIVETAAPAGYVLDKTPHGIHIDPYEGRGFELS